MGVANMNYITSTLRSLGFTEYQAKAYVTLVGFGIATAREIHEKSDVPHGRIYSVLKDLADKGYVKVQEGTPTYYQAVNPGEVIGTLKGKFNEQIDASIATLSELHFETKIESPFWSIHSEWGVRNRMKTLIQNAKDEIIIFADNPEFLHKTIPEIKKVHKRVNVTILSENKDFYRHMQFHVHEPGERLNAFFDELQRVELPGGISVQEHEHQFFMIVDGREAISVSTSPGKILGTVIKMPVLSFMMTTLFKLLDPAIGAGLPASLREDEPGKRQEYGYGDTSGKTL
ncbi:TrmB family transcriptional regulator [Methanogenium cariaci]|jgi:HTH-type transcriptional regulator, sugar sensing transcriptional regulator